MKLKNIFGKEGLFQALAVSVYCMLVGLIFWKGNELFDSPEYAGPVTVLILFSVSALICLLLVFYRPYNLFVAGKKKEAIDLILSTTLWLFTLFIIILLLAATIW